MAKIDDDRLARLEYAWNRWAQATQLLQDSGQGRLGEDLFDSTLPRIIARAQRAEALADAVDVLRTGGVLNLDGIHALWRALAAYRAAEPAP